jgi:hypothetical protein
MDGTPLSVTFELCSLEGTPQRYVLYTFAPHWRVSHFRAAQARGAEAMVHVPPDEQLESLFLFGEWEFFYAVSLLREARQLFADPNSDRFVFTAAIGLPGLSRTLVRDLMGIMRFYFNYQIEFDLYATLDEALAAMRERSAARSAVVHS